jgi:hypothetical protein
VPLKVSFVRHPGERDHIYVEREFGTPCDWTFPTYGDQLPHDLCHLVVEEMLQISNGFWGLVDQGMEVQLIDDQGTLVEDGRPLSEHVQFNSIDLVRAEEAVALLAPTGMQIEMAGPLAVALRSRDAGVSIGEDVQHELGFALPAGCSPIVIAGIRDRLRELQTEWRALEGGGSITLSFARPVDS